MQIQELLDLISAGQEMWSAAKGAKSFKAECGELGKRVNRLSQLLKTLICFINSAPTPLYWRPVKIIVANVKHNFELVHAILYSCSCRSSLLGRLLINSRNATHFRDLFLRLDASIIDMQWLITVYNPEKSKATVPIDYKMSIIFLVWYCIASVQMGRQMKYRIHATECLRLLAQASDEYKQIIFEEGGVPPLQKLLKENFPLEAQIKAANALCLLADIEKERSAIIMKEMVTTILNRLSRTSTMSDQTKAVSLVASIAEHNPELKEYVLIRENVIWRLVTLLSSVPSSELKISCSRALLMLVRDSIANCRTLTETKGMFCLAKLVGTEQGELQYNCLMIIREITTIAESNIEFRHLAFKSSSPAATAVVDELLRVIKEYDDIKLTIPAIKSIGSLARSFSAKETRVISPLVARLDNTDQEVAMESAIALKKFVDSDNHLRSEHSKSIVEFNGVKLLMKLIFSGEKRVQFHGLELLCYLAKHDSNNSNVLIKAGALAVLKTTGRGLVAAEHPELKQLVSDAISELQLIHTDGNQESDSSTKHSSIKQIITEQSKAVFNFLRRHSKLLLERVISVYLPRLVNLQGVRKTLPVITRYKMRFVGALCCLKIWRIKPFLKAKCVELALRYYQVEMLAMKEIVQKDRLRKNFVNLLKKKMILEKFGYINSVKNVIVLCSFAHVAS